MPYSRHAVRDAMLMLRLLALQPTPPRLAACPPCRLASPFTPLACDLSCMCAPLQTEEPGVLPGWGTWSTQQREPKWMVEAREKAKRWVEGVCVCVGGLVLMVCEATWSTHQHNPKWIVEAREKAKRWVDGGLVGWLVGWLVDRWMGGWVG